MTEIIHIFCDYHAFDIVSIKMQKKKKWTESIPS